MFDGISRGRKCRYVPIRQATARVAVWHAVASARRNCANSTRCVCRVLSHSLSSAPCLLWTFRVRAKGGKFMEDAESTPPLLLTERPDVYSSVFTLSTHSRYTCTMLINTGRVLRLAAPSDDRRDRYLNYLGRSVGVMRSGVQIS